MYYRVDARRRGGDLYPERLRSLSFAYARNFSHMVGIDTTYSYILIKS